MSNLNPGLFNGQVPTAGQWNSYFSTKQDWTPILDTIIAGSSPSTGIIGPSVGGTGLGAFTTGAIIYASSASVLSLLSAGANGKVLTLSGGLPVWASASTGTVTSVAISGGTTGLATSGGPITSAGTITLSGTLAVENGGTGVTTSTGTGSVVLATSPALVTPALGTPASGVVTNLTGTASININGTVGATTPTTGAFTTLSTTGAASIQGLTVGLGASAVGSNTVLGNAALAANTTGIYNVAVGSTTLIANTTGTHNIAVGSYALTANTTGLYNTAVGYQGLTGNTTGNQNTASGMMTLYTNTTGIGNTATGFQALYANTTASYNIAIGFQALTTNTTGSSLTAVGYRALQLNTTASYNTALGYAALKSNTTGASNTAVGFQTLNVNTTGAYNTGVGIQALNANTTGSGNVMVGGFQSNGAYNPPFDPTTQNDRVVIGSAATTNAYVQVAWTAVSDARDKTDFGPVPLGLDFVTSLKPTTYRYKINRDDTEGHGPLRYGFLAQEVLALEGDAPVIIDNEDPDKLKITDQNLIAVLVNAIQELHARIAILETK